LRAESLFEETAIRVDQARVYRTIREQIADRIRTDVLSGRLLEGTSLREQTLARQYGVSRAPIRDALLQLTQEGLLVARPNCGVKVGAASSEEIQPLVVELRRKIEVFALRNAFGKLTEADVDRLYRQSVRLADFRVDRRFHTLRRILPYRDRLEASTLHRLDLPGLARRSDPLQPAACARRPATASNSTGKP